MIIVLPGRKGKTRILRREFTFKGKELQKAQNRMVQPCTGTHQEERQELGKTVLA
jgi:hypothetical protein